jgi:hypothetical protein
MRPKIDYALDVICSLNLCTSSFLITQTLLRHTAEMVHMSASSFSVITNLSIEVLVFFFEPYRNAACVILEEKES